LKKGGKLICPFFLNNGLNSFRGACRGANQSLKLSLNAMKTVRDSLSICEMTVVQVKGAKNKTLVWCRAEQRQILCPVPQQRCGVHMVNLFGPADLPLNGLPESRHKHDDSMAHDRDPGHAPVSMPAVEVVEVNDDAAWALWEDSVAFQDSQFATDAMFQSTVPTPLDVPEATEEFTDPFASVHKKSR
jgi:hypothetical protein